MSLKLCLWLAVVALLAIPLVGANTSAGFVLGTLNMNVCPAGSVSVGTAEECELAVTALGYSGSPSASVVAGLGYPKGCFRYVTSGGANVYFNTHQTGSAHRSIAPICKLKPIEPSNEPTSMPSMSYEPTSMPAISNETTSMPSISNEPTSMPSISNEPTSIQSNEPTSIQSNEPTSSADTSAGFVLGTLNMNVCPAGSVSVGTVAECISAATALGYTYSRAYDAGTIRPKECFLRAMSSSSKVYFNTHETGGTHTSSQPICAPSMPSNEPTAYVQGPISTTCFDLKTSFQNNSCCSQDTGKAATFNGTVVTCGNVLASYKSSECCDADLAKNATMIFE